MSIIYKVLCLDDDGHYVMATSYEFASRVQASAYIIPIDKSRKAVIIATGSN